LDTAFHPFKELLGRERWRTGCGGRCRCASTEESLVVFTEEQQRLPDESAPKIGYVLLVPKQRLSFRECTGSPVMDDTTELGVRKVFHNQVAGRDP
jgi:hypothetical protein